MKRGAPPQPEALADEVRVANPRAVAEALTRIEDRRPEAAEWADRFMECLIAGLPPNRSHVIGLTGPPGAGKSSLMSRLAAQRRKAGQTVGILAVDPTSPKSGGAILGDRIRMETMDADEGLFMRSLATRGRLGGLVSEIWPLSRIMMAAFDVVFIETVGVGQSETDVADSVDTVLLVLPPAGGDIIQLIKAGIMEIPDIWVVNKMDLGAPAIATLGELTRNLDLISDSKTESDSIFGVSAVGDTGIDRLDERIIARASSLLQQGILARKRKEGGADWAVSRIREAFGRYGIERLGGIRPLREAILQAPNPVTGYRRMHEQLLLLLGQPTGDTGEPY